MTAESRLIEESSFVLRGNEKVDYITWSPNDRMLMPLRRRVRRATRVA